MARARQTVNAETTARSERWVLWFLVLEARTRRSKSAAAPKRVRMVRGIGATDVIDTMRSWVAVGDGPGSAGHPVAVNVRRNRDCPG